MIWMEAQQDVAQARVDAKTRVQEAEATVAVTLVGAGLNFVQEKDGYCREPHAGSGLRSSVEGTTRGSCVALPDPSALGLCPSQHPPECSLDLVDCTMQPLTFMSGTLAGVMQRCNIAIRRPNPIWNSVKRRGSLLRFHYSYGPSQSNLPLRPDSHSVWSTTVNT
jgi:hypothetical protein